VRIVQVEGFRYVEVLSRLDPLTAGLDHGDRREG
jgi:hypothetical protein